MSFLPKIKVEVVVPSAQVDKALEAIQRAPLRGARSGDGKIFVSPIEHVPGEADDNAL